MSERLDFVVIEGGTPTIHHLRWGATGLFAWLLDGPEKAVREAREWDVTDQLDDLLAGCVIDLDRRVLVVAGPADVLCASSRARPGVQEHELLGALAPFWPGWRLAYEPLQVVEAVALYVRGLGLPLRSLNEPHVVPAALGEPRFVEPRFTLDAPETPSLPELTLPPGADPAKRLDELDLSVRATNELQNTGIETLGDLVAAGARGLAERAISEKVVREVTEILDWMRSGD